MVSVAKDPSDFLHRDLELLRDEIWSLKVASRWKYATSNVISVPKRNTPKERFLDALYLIKSLLCE